MWEDTVMLYNYRVMCGLKDKSIEENLELQAKISFKAGIREVVEWVKNNMWKQGSIERWQAQLKVWGIEDDLPNL